MKLNIAAFSGATAIVTIVLFTLCALFIALAPGAAYAFFSYLFHVDLSGSAYPMTWGVFLGGLVAWGGGMGLTAAALAWLYNGLTRTPR